MKLVSLLFLFLAGSCHVTNTVYSLPLDAQSPPELDPSQLEEAKASKDSWFIKFYAPWCGHCKRLAPLWEEAYRQLNGPLKVRFGSVNCVEHAEACKDNKIAGYPTLKFYDPAGQETKFQEMRDMEHIRGFLERVNQPHVEELSDCSVYDLQERIKSGGVMFVLFVDPKDTSESDVETEFEVAAHHFNGRADFVRCGDTEGAGSAYALQTFPSVLVLKDGNAVHWSPRRHPSLKEWIETNQFPLVLKLNMVNVELYKKQDDVLLLGIGRENDNGAVGDDTKQLIESLRESSHDSHNSLFYSYIDYDEFPDFCETNFHVNKDNLPLLVIWKPYFYEFASVPGKSNKRQIDRFARDFELGTVEFVATSSSRDRSLAHLSDNFSWTPALILMCVVVFLCSSRISRKFYRSVRLHSS
eukprot:Clim_evm8s26 gene=Clim_evmTU8s26